MVRTIALLLRRSIEKALDAAKIAIIPIPGRANDNTKWRVILIDQSMSNIQAYQDVMSDRPKGVVKWKVSKNSSRFDTMILSGARSTSMVKSSCF